MAKLDKKIKNMRKQVLIDRKTQYQIAYRLVLFWLVGGMLVAGLPLMVMFAYGTMIAMQSFELVLAQVVDAMWFPLVMSFVVIPAGIWYSIRFSNRIAGPIFRIRRELNRLAEGQESFSVTLREKDFFKDLADSYNSLRQRVLLLEESYSQDNQSGKQSAEPSSTDSVPLPVVDSLGISTADNTTV